ncbi:MAG: cation diffusion facilitator family transporter [Kiloniellales bacterium]|nr:cation diffusion facilitator family transporter [Kiloniellales bacterium]
MSTTQEIRTDPSAERLMRLATYAAVATALVLIVVKLVAYLLTDSVSLLSSLMDSVLDAMASLVNLVAVRHALVPPDREHRFGHGKAEPLAGLAQAAFISGSALFLAVEAGHRLFAPRIVTHVDIGIGVSVFAIVATFILTRFQLYVVKRTGSIAIEADSLHYLGDLLINGAVIVALILASRFGWIYADALFGLAIALYLIFNAVRIARAALDMLMDRELPEEDRRRIKEIVMSHGEVLDMHDLRTRTSGRQCFIQLHLELDGDMPLFDAHHIADTVEAALMEAFPQAEVLIHQDPHGLEEPPVHQVS